MPRNGAAYRSLLRMSIVLALLGAAGLSQPRKVTIYPVSHDVKEWEALRNGSLYRATRYSAIVTVDVDPKAYIEAGGAPAPKLYSIHCDVTKTWDHCHELIDASYPAEIDGKHMNITAQWGGNQHKSYSDKYEIDDIRPVGSE